LEGRASPTPTTVGGRLAVPIRGSPQRPFVFIDIPASFVESPFRTGWPIPGIELRLAAAWRHSHGGRRQSPAQRQRTIIAYHKAVVKGQKVRVVLTPGRRDRPPYKSGVGCRGDSLLGGADTPTEMHRLPHGIPTGAWGAGSFPETVSSNFLRASACKRPASLISFWAFSRWPVLR